jgi:hypothetical protein
MKTERRHELQTNELADWLGKGVELVEQNGRAVLAIIVAVAICLVAYLYIRSESTNKRVQRWDRYFQALNNRDMPEMLNLAESDSSSPVGAWARLYVADEQLVRGTNQLFQNRAEANDQLRRAADNYRQVADSSPAAKEPLLHQRALWGLARSLESLNRLDEARETYARLADTSIWKPAIFARQAERRLKDLNEQSTKEFYDWFAKQEPSPPAGLPEGMPAELEKLPDEPPVESSSASQPPAVEGQEASAAQQGQATEARSEPPEGGAPSAPAAEQSAPSAEQPPVTP